MALVDLSISRKGLLLVSVPLLFELVFVVCLLLMLQESERRVVEQTRSKTVVATLNDLGSKLLTAGYMLFLWRASHSDDCIKRYKMALGDLRGLCGSLTELSRGNPRREAHAKRLFQISEKVIYLTSNFAKAGETGPLSMLSKETYVIELERAFQSFLDQQQTITKEELQLQEGGSELEQRSKSMLYALIFSAIGFNILLTVALAIYFSRSITRRLSTVMSNTELLAQHRPLHTPIEGKDEIATLDHVFHRMAQALEHSEKMKAEFVSMISHDLKAPLTSIQTAVNLLSTSVKNAEDEKQQRRFGVLERNVAGMVKLVTDLLEMDKIESGVLKLEIEEVDLTVVIAEAVESMRFFAEQYKVEIKIEPVSGPVVLEIDPGRVGQVLTNLITNSIKFSRPGGCVMISVERRRDYIAVNIEDQGRGIPPEDIDKIFDRFKQVEQEDSSIKGGTGLGLAICKALVELHHGTIAVTSMLGRGSTFTFCLPVVQSREDSRSRAGGGKA